MLIRNARSKGVTAIVIGALLSVVSWTATPPQNALASGSPSVTVSNFSAFTGAATSFTVTVTDFSSADYLVVMSVSSGTLELASTSGITATGNYARSGASEIGFQGSLADISAAMTNMSYTATADGSHTLDVRLSQVGTVTSSNGSDPASGPLYLDPSTGHYFEYVSNGSNISWTNAASAAARRTLFGMTGYLGTLDTAAQNQFVASKMAAPNIWIGATDDITVVNAAVAGNPGTEGHWYWTTGPTAERVKFSTGSTAEAGRFASWAGGEPNNASNLEHFAVTNWSGSTGQWNDLPDSYTGVSAYIVEYGGVGVSTAQTASATATITASTLAVSSLNPSSGSAAGGNTVVITGTGFTGTPSVTVGGTPIAAGSITLDSATQITVTLPTRTGNDKTVGAQAVVVSIGSASSNSDVLYTYRPVLGTVGNTRVWLNELASRSQRGEITRTATAPFFVSGTDSRTGESYLYQTDILYSGRSAYSRESDERNSSFTATAVSSGTPIAGGPSVGTGPLGLTALKSGANCGTGSGGSGNTFGTPAVETFCSVFGPEVYSEAFFATAGQALSFDWYAKQVSDDYEVYAFLVKVDDASSIPAGRNARGSENEAYLDRHTLVMHSLGSSPSSFTTASAAIPVSGLYRFRFVNGSYDASGGFALGSEMYIKNTILVGTANTISAPTLSDQVAVSQGPLTWSNYQFSVSATSAGAVSVAASGNCTATAVGAPTTTITVTNSGGLGACTLQFSQGQTGVYAPAAAVTRSFQWRDAVVVPLAPTITSVTPAAGQLSVAFLPPSSDGGAALSNYEYSVDGGANWTPLSTPSTTSPLVIQGLTGGTAYSVRVRAVNSAGAGAQSNLVAGTPTGEVTPTPSPSPASPAPQIVQQTQVPLGPQRPRQVTLPPQQPVQSPVLQNNQLPQPPVNPQALVNGVPTQVSTVVPNPNNLNIRTGVLNIAVNVQTNEGLVRQGTNGETEVQVRKGGVTGFQGTGLAPRSVVQVFMPLQGTNAKELARIPVDEAGTFTGEAVFATSLQEAPLPIGRQVLQMVTVDEQGRQNVVEFTVNIAQPPPAPEQNREEGATPQLLPGQSLATNAGVPEVVQVTALQDEKQTIIEGDGWTMAVDVNNPNASVQETEDGGVLLELVRDEEATVSGSGFMPGTRADVWLFSEPTLLGTVDIDENGEFNGTVSVDGQVVAVGEHTLQLQGVGMDGYVRAANLGVVVNDEEVLADGTAEAAGGFLWWWLILVLVAVLVVVGYLWWRRRQSQSA